MDSQKDKSQMGHAPKDHAALPTMTPIGVLRTEFNYKFGTPRQGALAPSSRARFDLAAEWSGQGIFTGLEGFSHIWLLSYFHQNKNTRAATKIHPPRLLGEAVGILASRSPHRPNSIGLTLAKIEEIDGDRLVLSGVDLVNGTPVLDIKPYLPEADRPSEFLSGWPGKLAVADIACEFSKRASEDLENLSTIGVIKEKDRFVKLADEVFRLDPRPLAYRSRINECFAIVIDDVDVHARYNEGKFTIETLQPYAPESREQWRSKPELPAQP